MASEGVLIPNFYTAAAICSPSRASLLTGRLPLRNGFYADTYHGRNAYTPQEIVGGIPDSELLISEALSQAGYHTKLVGKWHLGHQLQYLPLRHGFDEFFGSPNCHMLQYPMIPVFRDSKMIGRYYHQFPINRDASMFPDTNFPYLINRRTGESNFTILLRDEALSFIKKHARSREENDEPFFLYWTPDATHAPAYASKPYLGTSKRGSFYGDCVREVDAAIGDIIDVLHEEDIASDTLVIFTSDNGAAMVSKEAGGTNGPLACGKQTTFEGGFRVPTIAWWPGNIRAGRVSAEIGTQMDLFPTFMELAGAEIPKDLVLDGASLLPSWLNETENSEKSVFYYRGNVLYAIRKGNYKMHIWTWTTPVDELLKGIDHCPDFFVPNVTTTEQRDHSKMPILYHIGRDPGEKFPIAMNTDEYFREVASLKQVEKEHVKTMVKGEPQLNWCDSAVMHWAPPGCEELDECFPRPPSHPYQCVWPH